jgi:hypothetical protein
MGFIFINLFSFFQLADSFYVARVFPPEQSRLNQPICRMRAARAAGGFNPVWQQFAANASVVESELFRLVPLAEQAPEQPGNGNRRPRTLGA